jgi:REP element-mobilizing transposase RayT
MHFSNAFCGFRCRSGSHFVSQNQPQFRKKGNFRPTKGIVIKMDQGKELPKRKSTRLKNYDYSSTGVYFVTICIRDRKQILSKIVKTVRLVTGETGIFAVGEGLAPPARIAADQVVGEGLAFPAQIAADQVVEERLASPEYSVRLKPCGEVVRAQLQQIENRFPSVSVKDYVIMPDHIHMILHLRKNAGGASPSPTLDDVICAFKSLTSRDCKRRYGIERMFQRSSAEHIIRDREDYETRRKYIYENPKRWYYKYLNAEK